VKCGRCGSLSAPAAVSLGAQVFHAVQQVSHLQDACYSTTKPEHIGIVQGCVPPIQLVQHTVCVLCALHTAQQTSRCGSCTRKGWEGVVSTACASAAGTSRSGCSIAPGPTPESLYVTGLLPAFSSNLETALTAGTRTADRQLARQAGRHAGRPDRRVHPTQAATCLLMLLQHRRLCFCCFMVLGACDHDKHAWTHGTVQSTHRKPIHRPGPPHKPPKCQKPTCVAMTLLFCRVFFSALPGCEHHPPAGAASLG
jgi:hypothetical protein